MAPEVILGEGYSFTADFWSIAVCLYEFYCGAVPFGDNADDPMDVYVAIVKTELAFPKFIKDKDFISLMKNMLCKNTVKRLIKLSLIKKHEWFVNFNFEKLESMECEVAYVSKKKIDDSNLVSTTMYTEVAKVIFS